MVDKLAVSLSEVVEWVGSADAEPAPIALAGSDSDGMVYHQGPCRTVLPTEADVAQALSDAYDPPHLNGLPPVAADRAAARAVLAMFATMADLVVIYRPDHPNLGERVLPTETEVADALHADACPEDPDDGESCTCADYLREARIVLELFASQPTVAQVKAEAWGKGYVAACDRYGHELGTYGDRMEPNPYRESEG